MMKHIILTRIDEEGFMSDVMVDGSKILTVVDHVRNRNFECATITIDTNSPENIQFLIAEPAVDVMKKVDECDRLNRR